ncbi:MAG: DUF4836 family protein [Prevotella sp.]|nr:DUF4836 family protein [Prevotella sp.]
MRTFNYLFTIVLGVWLTSCSKGDYVNSIPPNSIAIMSMDMGRMNGIGGGTLLKAILHVADVKTLGVDVSCPVYLFETENGNMGLCARIGSQQDLEKAIEEVGGNQPLQSFRGFQFTLLDGRWAVGFSDETLLVMGPIVSASYPDMRRKMAKCLSNDGNSGISTSRLYQKLDSIDSPMKMVARVDALPERLMLPFMLGTPKDTAPSQVCVSARMGVVGDVLVMDSEAFSFNQRIDAALKEAARVYRPIEGQLVSALSSEALGGLFVNVKGESLLPLMRENRGFQTLLAGMNTEVDMDSIVRSVDGDFCLVVPAANEQPPKVCYSDGKVLRQWEGKVATSTFVPDTKAQPDDLRKKLLGKKMVLLVNMKLLKGLI